MNKPKILLAILAGHERAGWIPPLLMVHAFDYLRDQQYEVALSIEVTQPVALARNRIAQQMLKLNVDWLFSIDNDVCPPPNVLRVLDAAGPEHRTIFLPYHQHAPAGPLHLTWSSEHERLLPGTRGFTEIWKAGTGAHFVHRSVFEKISPPWYMTELTPDGLGLVAGEDYHFCRRVREAGFKLWTHGAFTCSHFHTADMRQQFELMDGSPMRPH